jgi:hypothetical protein
VLDPNIYGSKPGFIDQATLVIEPHGAYAENSLYVTYSDHDQYAGSSQLEIDHLFDLPAGSTVSDMWLWIGDSVMQAIVIDTWTARHIYDSIVNKHRDPGFLSKTGDQFELQVFPLTPGSYRKVKITYITPISWSGQTAIVALPMNFLLANNNTAKPLDVLFRQQSPVWGVPGFVETGIPSFVDTLDTLGYMFKRCHIPDVTGKTSLHLTFSAQFTGGIFFGANQNPNSPTYFQLGVIPGQAFNAGADTTPRSVLVGIDLSGGPNRNIPQLVSNVSGVLKSALRPVDTLSIMVAGTGTITRLTPYHVAGSSQNIDTMLDAFANSSLARTLDSTKMPNLVYCDSNAQINWGFQGIDSLAAVKSFGSIAEALSSVSSADIVAAYNYGYEDESYTAEHLEDIVSALDTLFLNGGRFLGYYDYNRANVHEPLGPHFFPGLTEQHHEDSSTTLYRNTNGNIGRYFPETVVEYGFDFLQYNADTSIKVELSDINGNPVVISKRIDNGLMVISSIWSFHDADALKKILGVPLLGLNASTKSPQQISGLLTALKNEDQQQALYRSCMVFSNGDSVVSVADAKSWVSNYLRGFSITPPAFQTINLLDGALVVPPYITENLVQYYGSGYLLQALSDSSSGIHFETHITDWLTIGNALAFNAGHALQNLTLGLSVDDSTGSVLETRAINPSINTPNAVYFYLGSTTAQYKLSFNLAASFTGLSGTQTKHLDFFLTHDSAQNETVIPAMLANEDINSWLAALTSDSVAPTSSDTERIVSQAVKYRLLCNFTAMLALEPNDTLHFLPDPLDESELFTGVKPASHQLPDSISLDAFPNPFNNSTTLVITLNYASDASVTIYNILGQKVKEFNDLGKVNGVRYVRWDGSNGNNVPVSSGIYFARLVSKDRVSGQTRTLVKKLLFMK